LQRGRPGSRSPRPPAPQVVKRPPAKPGPRVIVNTCGSRYFRASFGPQPSEPPDAGQWARAGPDPDWRALAGGGIPARRRFRAGSCGRAMIVRPHEPRGRGRAYRGQSPLTQNLTTQNVGSEFVGHVRAGLVEHVVVFVIVVRGGAIREDHPTDEDVKLLRIRNMVDIPQRLVLAG